PFATPGHWCPFGGPHVAPVSSTTDSGHRAQRPRGKGRSPVSSPAERARRRVQAYLRRAARRPRNAITAVRAHPSTRAAVDRSKGVFERAALARGAQRDRRTRSDEWARLLRQLTALPTAGALDRTITTVVIGRGETAAGLLVDRRAYEAAGGMPESADADIAVFELCRRLRARGGGVVALADALVVDARPVPARRALGEPVATDTEAWRTYVEAHG